MCKFLSKIILIIFVICGNIDTVFSNPFGNTLQNKNSMHQYYVYKDNYIIDIEPLGIMDLGSQIGNAMVNMLWGLVRWLVIVCCELFYALSETFNIVKIILQSNVVENVSSNLYTSLFKGILPVAIIFIFIKVLELFIKKNIAGIFGEGVKYIFISIFAFLLTANIGTIIKTADASAQELTTLSISGFLNMGGYKDVNYSVAVPREMWDSLVHKPWLEINFYGGTELNEADKEELLNKNISDRQKNVEELVKSHNKFSKNIFPTQIFMTLVIGIVSLVKAFSLVIIAAMLALQRFFIAVLLLIGIFVMVFSLFPALGGEQQIIRWLNSILQAYINLVLISLLLGLILLIDKLVQSSVEGWLMVSLIQSLIFVAIFVYRNKIFELLKINPIGLQKIRLNLPINGTKRLSDDIKEKPKNDKEKPKNNVINNYTTYKNIQNIGHISNIKNIPSENNIHLSSGIRTTDNLISKLPPVDEETKIKRPRTDELN